MGKVSRGEFIGRGAAAAMTLVLLAAAPAALLGQTRARDLGVPFDGTPGPLNAITDVAGVEVGHATVIRGHGRLVVGQGPVRTGVTAILPRGRASGDPVFAAWFPLNGNGEMTGTTWVDESGTLTGPVMITNTHSVGVVRDAVVQWMVERDASNLWLLPVVAETWDGILNDLNGFHVGPEHAMEALEAARGGAVTEGAVGGGTGMICNGFKGGIGTSSRRLPASAGGYTVGVLVQCNYGAQSDLRIAGVPVGGELAAGGVMGRCRVSDITPTYPWLRSLPRCDEASGSGEGGAEPGEGGAAPGTPADSGAPAEYGAPRQSGGSTAASGAGAHEGLGSIIIVVATDAPLLPHQLERVIKRAALGLARDGGIAHNGSGDIFMAFSTSNHDIDGAERHGTVSLEMLPNGAINPLFYATVQATEEAIINAMVAAETMTGADDIRIRRLPHDGVRQILREHRRIP